MLAKAMNDSRSMPTATSFRTLPVDTLDAKRKAINSVLKERGMKVSFTHLIAWAIVQAATEWPVMGRSYEERDGKPFVVEAAAVNLGIAVDVERRDGSRSLMVPCVKGADSLDFPAFHASYEDLITKTRENKLTADDFQGTTITLTNPGGLGTVASVPRLLNGQGTIVACGSLAYPVEWAHASADKIKALGVSKVMTTTSTYDHRIIQGAESGSFLRRIDQLLQGEDEFYESIAEALDIAAGVITNAHPAAASAPPLGAAGVTPAAAQVSVAEADRELLQGVQAATSLLKAYRTHGHLAANVNPLNDEPKGDPALEPENLNLTPELMSRIPASILRIGVEGETLLEALPRMRDAYCTTIAYQIEHLSSHQQRMWLRERIETGWHRAPLDAGGAPVAALAPDRGVPVRALPPEGLPGPEDVLDRGPRRHRADARCDRDDRAPRRCRGGRDRHGPSRPAVGARPQPRPLGGVDPGRVRGREGARAGQGDRPHPALGNRRRQVPPRRRGDLHHPRRGADQGPALSRTPATWSSSTRSSPAPRAPRRPSIRARPCATTRTSRCRSCCTAMPPSRARGWSPRPSTSSRCRATRPAARST